MYPKARMDSLTDGVFAVAMTLLVLDVRFPEGAAQDTNVFWSDLTGLWPKFFPYLLSFFVIGVTWLARLRTSMSTQLVNRSYAFFWLLNLLAITLIPFSTIVLGRFHTSSEAVWLYCANIAFNGLTALGMALSLRDTRQHWPGPAVIVFASAVAATITVVSPRLALWAFALNALPLAKLGVSSAPNERGDTPSSHSA